MRAEAAVVSTITGSRSPVEQEADPIARETTNDSRIF